MSTQATVLHPVVMLRVNGEANAAVSAALISFEYTDRIKKRDEARMVFADRERELLDQLDVNATWEVRWGYPGKLSNVRVLTLATGGAAFDDKAGQLTLSFRVTRGRSTSPKASLTEPHRTHIARNWGKTTSSQIAQKIARRHRLKFVGTDSDDEDTAYVQSENLSDYQYLAGLAEDIGYEFFIEGSTLYYRAKPYDQRPSRTLYYFPGGGRDTFLKSFNFEFKTVPVNVKPAAASTAKLPPKNVEELLTQLTDDEHSRLSDIATQLKEDLDIEDASVAETAQLLRVSALTRDVALFGDSSIAQVNAVAATDAAAAELERALNSRALVREGATEALTEVQEAILAQRQQTFNGSKTGDECKDKQNPDLPDGGETPTGGNPASVRYTANLGNGPRGFTRQEGKATSGSGKRLIPPIVTPFGVPLTFPLDATLLTPETQDKKRHRVACATHSKRKDKAVKATMVCVGDPELRAKIVYDVRSTSRRASGLWYAEEARHMITNTYEVTLTCKRGTLKTKGKGKGKDAKKTDPEAPTTRVENIRELSLGNTRYNRTSTREVPIR